MSTGNTDSNENGWGWEVEPNDNGNEDSVNSTQEIKIIDESSRSKSITSVKSSKSFDSKQMALKNAADSLMSGMTSSPSFQELEKAIGATLATGLSVHGDHESNSFFPSGRNFGGLSKVSSYNNVIQKQQFMQQQFVHSKDENVKEELKEFLIESESRAIILFHNPNISPATIRDSCQKKGILYYIRPEFHSKGVTLLSYFDLRSAVNAVKTLPNELGVSAEASAHFSIMLHASSNNVEEFRLVIKNLPLTVSGNDLKLQFSRYGEVLSIEKKQVLENSETHHIPELSNALYFVEYFNIQDSRSALTELSATSSQIWDTSTSVSFSPLNQQKQILCRQMLAVMAKWRSVAAGSGNQFTSSQVHFMGRQPTFVNQNLGNNHNMQYQNGNVYYSVQQNGRFSHDQAVSRTQLVQYNNIPVTVTLQPSAVPMAIPYSQPHQSQIMQSGISNYDVNSYQLGFQQASMQQQFDAMKLQSANFANSAPNYHTDNKDYFDQQKGVDAYGNYRGQDFRPYHHHGGILSTPIRRNRAVSNQQVPVDAEFTLDIHRIENSSENRTTVMVRNIPNKYTQRMLLEEVDLNFKGTYDFFYLPIDFKNKCNVGYCFINFLDPKYIVDFVSQFDGHRWRNFNSEKVCAVSFARIQGKMAMIARFQNSSLLEKHDEYRPLLFFSNGPERGQPEPFPTNSKVKTTYNSSRQYNHQIDPNQSQEIVGINNSAADDL